MLGRVDSVRWLVHSGLVVQSWFRSMAATSPCDAADKLPSLPPMAAAKAQRLAPSSSSTRGLAVGKST